MKSKKRENPIVYPSGIAAQLPGEGGLPHPADPEAKKLTARADRALRSRVSRLPQAVAAYQQVGENTDPEGSYTGLPDAPIGTQPVQDADDL